MQKKGCPSGTAIDLEETIKEIYPKKKFQLKAFEKVTIRGT